MMDADRVGQVARSMQVSESQAKRMLEQTGGFTAQGERPKWLESRLSLGHVENLQSEMHKLKGLGGRPLPSPRADIFPFNKPRGYTSVGLGGVDGDGDEDHAEGLLPDPDIDPSSSLATAPPHSRTECLTPASRLSQWDWEAGRPEMCTRERTLQEICEASDLDASAVREASTAAGPSAWQLRGSNGMTPLHSLCQNPAVTPEALTIAADAAPHSAWSLQANDDPNPAPEPEAVGAHIRAVAEVAKNSAKNFLEVREMQLTAAKELPAPRNPRDYTDRDLEDYWTGDTAKRRTVISTPMKGLVKVERGRWVKNQQRAGTEERNFLLTHVWQKSRSENADGLSEDFTENVAANWASTTLSVTHVKASPPPGEEAAGGEDGKDGKDGTDGGDSSRCEASAKQAQALCMAVENFNLNQARARKAQSERDEMLRQAKLDLDQRKKIWMDSQAVVSNSTAAELRAQICGPIPAANSCHSWTPLHFLCANSRLTSECLATAAHHARIPLGAWRAEDEDGWTPLHAACDSTTGALDDVSLSALLRRVPGATWTVSDHVKRTALHLLLDNQTLESRGAQQEGWPNEEDQSQPPSVLELTREIASYDGGGGSTDDGGSRYEEVPAHLLSPAAASSSASYEGDRGEGDRGGRRRTVVDGGLVSAMPSATSLGGLSSSSSTAGASPLGGSTGALAYI